MTRQEAKEYFWCDTDKFGESVARKFGSVNYNKIFTGYYIGSEIDKFIDKIYDEFEEREKFLATKDVLCNDCKYYLSDNGNFPINPCCECSRFYSDMFERQVKQ